LYQSISESYRDKKDTAELVVACTVPAKNPRIVCRTGGGISNHRVATMNVARTIFSLFFFYHTDATLQTENAIILDVDS
jgi:hypothetical protein